MKNVIKLKNRSIFSGSLRHIGYLEHPDSLVNFGYLKSNDSFAKINIFSDKSKLIFLLISP